MREAAVAGLMCALIAALMGWPMPLDPSGVALGGGGGDFNSIAWGLWARPMGEVSTIFHPEGGVLIVSDPLEVWLLAPVTALFGAVATHNLWQLLHFGLAGGLAYALCREQASRAGAACGAALFAFSGVMVGAAHNGNADVTPLYWLPAVALLRHRPWLAGLAAGVGAWCNPYVGLGCAAVLAFTVDWRSMWKAAIPAGILAGAYLGVMRWSLAQPGSLVRKVTVGTGNGASLDQLFWAVEPTEHLQGTVDFYYLGLLGVGLALLGARQDRWLGLLALGVTLALGQVLMVDNAPWMVGSSRFALPMKWLSQLPGLESMQLHYRFAAMASLALAVWASRGADRLPARLRGVMPMLVLADMLRVGAPLLEGGAVLDSGVCEALEGESPGPVLNIPARMDEQWLLEQTCHGRPVAASINRELGPPITRAIENDDTDALADMGFRWLVLHTEAGMALIEL